MWLYTMGRLVTLVLGLLMLPLTAEAQQPGKIPRVGVLSPFISSADLLLETFRQGLREIGYMEGQNIAIEYRSAEGRTDRLPDLAAELVRLKVDIIVTTGAPAVQAAKGVTSTIPIVMAAVGDAVEHGFVTSLARPGGNIVGSSWLNTELTSKRLELFKEALPEMSRVAALWDSATGAAYFRPMEAAARSLAVQLQALEVRGPDDFDSAFQDARKGGAGGLVILPSPFFYAHRVRLVGLEATGICRSRWPHELWPELQRALPARRLLCGSNPQRGQACRPARGAAHAVRAGHQPQDRRSPRPDDPPDAPLPGG
jgi:putative tryptophan/tyrosine transport system substrate-binding protein